MFKYLKYYLSTLLLIIAIYVCTKGNYFPTYYLIGFSLFVIFGDILFGKDVTTKKFSYPQLLNLSIYVNLPLLLILLFSITFVFGDGKSQWIIEFYYNYLYIDLVEMKTSITPIDRISLITIISLFIGMLATVPGHELTHRKRKKIDMFIGNWLLALSWDCAFAIEHVYGHHKNVGFPSDPATAKRGENIYPFILKAILKEQKDAWLIEINHLRRRGFNPFGFRNKMIIGYLRSLTFTIIAYFVGGISGLITFLFCAFLAKSLLEVINYVEHYGLVREADKPVYPRHSWNSNNIISSVILYNVTKHSAHHEKSNLEFWELDSYEEAPTMPHGYLSMLYLVIFFPFVYQKMMEKQLLHWDLNYASDGERKIINQKYEI